ncbi:MAG: exodeoxyribonuclease V subunit beta [Gammaproteobacteria bacterium]|nr:exodeoxyribonuclease V subunit beta [Gammaproteobacteria bacterium]
MTDARPASTLDAKAILDLDLDGIKLIEASAGTGKTHAIADLYLRHILDGRLVSQILIVTFTNAATEELRGRIRQRLYHALALLNGNETGTDELMLAWHDRWRRLDRDEQEVQLGRLQLALRSLDEAVISTIHSFCQRSLQEHALAGQQMFESDLLSDDHSLWEAATKDWWRRFSYALQLDAWQLLRSKLGSIESLAGEILELRNKPAARLLPPVDLPLQELLEQPRKIAADLRQLTPLWSRHRKEIIEIVSTSKVLSRRKDLPYHDQQLNSWLDAANSFFNNPDIDNPFDDFEYLGTKWLHDNSKPSMAGKDPRFEHEFFKAIEPVAESWAAYTGTLGAQLRINALGEVSRAVRQKKHKIAALAFQDQLSLLLDGLVAEHGNSLAQSLRQQYPVAMIDEFQDTDNIQYQIFSLVYHAAENVSLTLIGDPKQAIYSFRGGDIFTYMQARNLPAIKRYQLQTNWRSQPELVHAINALFKRRAEAFIYHDSIDFLPVDSIPDNVKYQLRLNDRPAPALTLWQLPQKSQDKNYNRDDMRSLINQAIVVEITQLLELSRKGAAIIDGKPLRSGDLAILVRQASEGQTLSRALNQQGIRTVTIGRDSVFDSDEARGLYDLLLAISQHQNQDLAARSLASSLLAMDYRQIAVVNDDDVAWRHWLEDLAELQQLWERQGFIAMFEALLNRLQVTRQLALQDNGERRITNLLHLAELLRQQSGISAGMSSLLSWFNEQFTEKNTEAAELRLESDEALVKIVTIHKAKGLQYPVVFVPFLWSCKQVNRKKAIHFHDSRLQACLDLGSSEFAKHWLIAEKERLAEDMRLLYVATTRARSRLYLAWGQAGASRSTGNASQTALAFLLHSNQDAADLDSAVANGFPDDMDFEADLQSLVDDSAACIERVALPQRPIALAPYHADAEIPDSQLTRFTRSQMTHWRINSFTALTRGVHQPGNSGETESQADSILDFPAGSHVGLMLHSVLENIDFTADLEPQCDPLFTRFLPLAGISDQHRQTLTGWLKDILETQLDDSGLTLRRISHQSRLNELSFDFALDQIDIDALNRFMQSRSQQPLQAVSNADFCGLITGIIDLVFEHEGRYYVADYKSNFLGRKLQDYAPGRLKQAMFDRRYDLQSLIYSLALHRLLAQRLVDYDFESHFGGSYYLFLRAMRPAHGKDYGVYFDRPDHDGIEAFDALFRFTPPEAIEA